jgi:hypothetical protein
VTRQRDDRLDGQCQRPKGKRVLVARKVAGWLLLAGLLALADPASGQAFEGIVRQRSITVPPYIVSQMLGSAYTLSDADRVFAIDLARLLEEPDGTHPSNTVQVVEMTYSFLGSHTRIDFSLPGSPVGDVYVLEDSQLDTRTIVIPSLNAFIIPTGGSLEGARELTGGALLILPRGEDVGPARMLPLPDRLVNGISADGFEIRSGDEMLSRGWTAPTVQGASMWTDLTADDPHAILTEWGLPMLLQSMFRVPPPMTPEIGGGYLYSIIETLSAERMVPSSDLFVVPRGFQRMYVN